MSTTVVLSPHPDDAVLSAWHVLAGPGDVAVVTVFAGIPPPGPLSWWDELSGAPDRVSWAAERIAEDRDALALAGCTPVALDFIDAQYRRGPQLLEPIVERVAGLAEPGTRILAPAGLAAHPDHRLVLAVALALRDRGREVALYADVPHAPREGWPGWVTGASDAGDEVDSRWRADLQAAGLPLERLEPEVHRLDAGQEAAKRAAVARYRTQLGALEARFGLLSRPDMLRYEVVWRLAAVPSAV